tara:strand:+ start:264 stop:608 length:345 start_codon:yes stop_codon:yes gene_type:complete
MYALTHKNKVVQVEKETFPVHKSLVWVECSEDVRPSWDYLEGVFVAPVEVVPTEEEIWLEEVISSDTTLISRDLENIIDALDEETKSRIDSFTIRKYTSKKELRQRNPLKIQPK